MKQKVDFTQLVELEDAQKNELLKWWNEKKGCADVPLLSIGEMIELLRDFNLEKGRFCVAVEGQSGTSVVDFSNGSEQLSSSFEDREICDALWKAVKSVL